MKAKLRRTELMIVVLRSAKLRKVMERRANDSYPKEGYAKESKEGWA